MGWLEYGEKKLKLQVKSDGNCFTSVICAFYCIFGRNMGNGEIISYKNNVAHNNSDFLFYLGRATKMRFNILRPRDVSGPLPCVIFVFGGGMAINTPDMYLPASEHFAHAV
jgi:hypothetical protein